MQGRRLVACFRSERFESWEIQEWRQCAFPLAFGASTSDQAIEEDVLAFKHMYMGGAGNQCTRNTVTLRRAGPATVLCLMEGHPWEEESKPGST